MYLIFENTVSLVHFLYFPNVRAPFDDIEIELIPERQSCQFPTREMSNRRKIKTIDDPIGGIHHYRYKGEFNEESADLHIDETIFSDDAVG